MANLTLAIDDDLLKRARIRAVQEGTSVNSVVRAHLAAYADTAGPRNAAQRFVDIARDHPDTGVGSDRNWARDDIYQERIER